MLKSVKIAAVSIFVVIGVASPVGVANANGEKTIATVNSIAIPQMRLDLDLESVIQPGRPVSHELREQVKEELIDLELFAQEARKQGVDKMPEVAQRIELNRQKILRAAFAQDFIRKHPISEETLKQEYEKQKKILDGKKEYRVAHILVDSEKEAKEIAASLQNKGKFDKIAKVKSKDQGSKEQGGELGWSLPAAFAKPFAEALPKLIKGQISEPVQTQYGWHIIKLDDIRDFVLPPYDQVKDELGKRMQQKALREAVKAIRATAKIN